MADREKVIKGLECCAVKIVTPDAVQHCGICPYDRERNGEMDFDCQNDLLCAALELLKAQEPVRPNSRRGSNRISLVWTCGKCGADLEPNNAKAKYCSSCGQAVKWDD